jgi:hypothetical protein
MEIAGADEQGNDGLAAGLKAEFISLFDGVAGVAAGIGKAHHLGAGALGLQQERLKIWRDERMLDRAYTLPHHSPPPARGPVFELPRARARGHVKPVYCQSRVCTAQHPSRKQSGGLWAVCNLGR